MYKSIHIEIKPNLTEEDCETIKSFAIKKLKIKYDNSYLIFDCPKDETLQDLEQFLKSKKYKYNYEMLHTIYENDDLQQFDYFYCDGQIIPNTTIEYFDYEADYNEGFDMTNYCPKCRKGAIQIGPLRTTGCHINIFKTKKLLTPFWNRWFANNELTEKLKKANLTGLDILPVYNTKMEELPYIHQLKPNNIVKDLFVPEIYRYGEKCRYCENYKNIICLTNKNLKNKNDRLKKETMPVNDLYIKKERLPLLKDFNETYERHFHYVGYYIISKKFLNVMLDAGIRQDKDVRYWPLMIK